MIDAYTVHPKLASAGYEVHRPDGSTLCVVCGHAKATAIAAELERLRLALHSSCMAVAGHMHTAGCMTTAEDQMAYHLARTEAKPDA
ncbi:MAG: hypothetical protein GX465_17605 [Acidobacteria bacterium]|jgi:hypothetical protein|nr:hypothetical protein [Acidobacteriota bacterium]